VKGKGGRRGNVVREGRGRAEKVGAGKGNYAS